MAPARALLANSMLAADARGKKRARDDAFPHEALAANDSHRNQRLKGANGKESFTVDVQRITVKKKKTTYLDTTSTTPPEGYAFLPVGYRKIKEQCRSECLRLGQVYYVVSENPEDIPTLSGRKKKFPRRKNIEHIKIVSDEIGRIGWHFPYRIVLAALDTIGAKTSTEAFGARNPLVAEEKPAKEVVTLENLYDLFKDLYPEMPDESIVRCATHAFLEEGSQKNKPRVGQVDTLPYGMRVQFAVNAHIRHVHTTYDSRINEEGKKMARLNVERPCVLMLIKWRGEDGEYEIEEQTQEVIVIESSDDDSDDDETDDALQMYDYSAGLGNVSDSDIEVLGFRDLRQNREHFRSGVVPQVFSPAVYSRPDWPRPVTLLDVPLAAVPEFVYNKRAEPFRFDPVTQTIAPAARPAAHAYFALTGEKIPTLRGHSRVSSWAAPAWEYQA